MMDFFEAYTNAVIRILHSGVMLAICFPVLVTSTCIKPGGTISCSRNLIDMDEMRAAISSDSINTQLILKKRNVMKYLKIFPAAAGIIALTATVSFARDQRECEEGDFCRTIIVNRDSGSNPGHAFGESASLAAGKKDGNVYHVEISRGLKTWLVSIDAYTGKILDLRESSATLA